MAAKFNHKVSDEEYFNQYSILLDVIHSQNSQVVDLCSQLNSFVEDTLKVQASETKRLFKEVGLSMKKFGRWNNL